MLKFYKHTSIAIQRFSSLAEQHKDGKDVLQVLQQKWKEYQEQLNNQKNGIIGEKLDKAQKEKIDFLVSNVSNLGLIELRYFEHLIQSQAMEKLQAKNQQNGSINQWMDQQEMLAKLWPQGQQGIANVLSRMSGGGSGGQATTSGATITEKVAEPSKVQVDKTNFDVQLVSFDAANKIKIIKEVRELLKLGLKDAKDLVDSAPCTLQKQVNKEDADVLKEKLEALKCQITLL